MTATNHTEASGPISQLEAMTAALKETNRQLCEQIMVNEGIRRENAILYRENARLQHDLEVLRETVH